MTLTAVYGQTTEAVTVTYHSNFAPDKPYTTAEMPNNSTITLPGYTDLGLPEIRDIPSPDGTRRPMNRV